MKKLKIENKKALVKQVLEFLVSGEHSPNEYVTLKKTGPIITQITAENEDSVVIKFEEPQPLITLNLDWLPDPTGKLKHIIITESYLHVAVDGLPDVRIAIVS